ncbi:hypothetical protein ACFYO0_22000 [Streptomyces sp. NPDC006365]|uniref:hypothetical protein n=1 Tax=Streptomyces sp. NPDC006365 TaxID=3364744 RepID=UPI0036B072DC
MTEILASAAPLITTARVLSAISADVSSRRIGHALPNLLDHRSRPRSPATDVSGTSILVVAAVIAVRKAARPR